MKKQLKSPKRKDDHGDTKDLDHWGSFFSEDDFRAIERECQISLSAIQKTQLETSLFLYRLKTEDPDQETTPTRQETHNNISKLIINIDSLEGYLSDANPRIASRVTDELLCLLGCHSKVDKLIAETRYNLELLKEAALNAEKDLLDENVSGERQKHLNYLYKNLQNIWESANGKQPYRIVFFEHILKKINIDAHSDWENIKRQINRLK